MTETIEPMNPFMWKRKCGHSYLANWSLLNPDTGLVEVYCVPCIAKAAGVKPAEILTPEQYQERNVATK